MGVTLIQRIQYINLISDNCMCLMSKHNKSLRGIIIRTIIFWLHLILTLLLLQTIASLLITSM